MKAIQIAVMQENEEVFGGIYILADDGSVWFRSNAAHPKWLRQTLPWEEAGWPSPEPPEDTNPK